MKGIDWLVEKGKRMVVYFTTVKRKRPVKEAGDLIRLDWTTKRILKRIPIFPFDPDIVDDPNPRGNSRGGKGILVSGSELLVGTYHSLLVFDLELNWIRKITNHLFVNIHEICQAGDNIWVSATAIDAAVLVNRQGLTLRSWWPRDEKMLQEQYGLRPMAIDKNCDNRLMHVHAELSSQPHHTHLNGVVKSAGHTYVLLNKQGIVVQIEPELKVVLDDSFIRGAHSPAVSMDGDRLLLCSSFNKSVLVYDLESGKAIQKIDLLKFAEVVNLRQLHPDQPFNQSIFVRGLEIIDRNRILVGVSPAAIIEVDVERGRLLDFYQHSADVGDAVHGLRHLPSRAMDGSV